MLTVLWWHCTSFLRKMLQSPLKSRSQHQHPRRRNQLQNQKLSPQISKRATRAVATKMWRTNCNLPKTRKMIYNGCNAKLCTPFISHQVLERNIYHIVEYIEWESRAESMNFWSFKNLKRRASFLFFLKFHSEEKCIIIEVLFLLNFLPFVPCLLNNSSFW